MSRRNIWRFIDPNSGKHPSDPDYIDDWDADEVYDRYVLQEEDRADDERHGL